ncbi:hypothetical protein BS47DRAFT_1379627 [Hydnum rufescens UP504]|uniref:Uncharacterized protein n=1 Tax=Hydnum rufescens UP504 TaxID=1448309 RepID=A0A9P6B6Y2_9AGAM|nr:hypothetical protein BS47DRAFT_1379627 [Hydnum rufescens UP504]
MEGSLGLVKDHPLALEIAGLRAALSNYEHASHVASIHLQRQVLELAMSRETTRTTLQRNAQLEKEAKVLRAHAEELVTPDNTQVAEITLALHRANDRLSSTESALLDRTVEVANLSAHLEHAESRAFAARQTAANAREREVQALARERETSNALRIVVEERNTYDRVVQEYADLVKTLEGRSSLNSTATSHSPTQSTRPRHLLSTHETILEYRHETQTILQELNAEIHRLHVQSQNIAAQLESCQGDLVEMRKIAEEDREKLAMTRVELQQHEADDTAAARLVSRYIRKDCVLPWITFTEDISRATFGRRREIVLRMKMLSREEQLLEGLVRWERKADEAYRAWSSVHSQTHLDSASQDSLESSFVRSLESAKHVLAAFDEAPAKDTIRNGSLRRLIMAQQTLEGVLEELNTERELRLALERERGGLRSIPLPVERSPISSPPHPRSSSEHRSSPTPGNLGITSLTPEANPDPSNISSNPPDSFPPDYAKPGEDGLNPTIQGPSLSMEGDSLVMVGIVPDHPSVEVATLKSAQIQLRLDVFLHRHDSVQEQFRNCHRNLSSLESDLTRDASLCSSQGAASDLRFASTALSLLSSAAARLHDFNDDAMVEIEIRMSDDARLVQGFRTLIELSNEETHQNTIGREVEALVDDRGPSSTEAFERKLADLEHDIATVKLAYHEISLIPSMDRSLSPSGTQKSENSSPIIMDSGSMSSWSRWTTALLTLAQPSSIGTLSSQTFGSVMTSPSIHSAPWHPSPNEFLQRLDFRIDMPFSIQDLASYEHHSSVWRSRTVSFAQHRIERTRNISGLGLRAASCFNTLDDGWLRSGPGDISPTEECSDSVRQDRADLDLGIDEE